MSVLQIMHIVDVDLNEAENILYIASASIVKVSTAAAIFDKKATRTNFLSTVSPC